MFVGDSITHGINTGSYRWDFHKIMVDNGVKYQETGYNSNNFQRGKDFILYSRDMSANTESIRVAYVPGKASDGVQPGFCVWLGSQLIGEACPAESRSGKPSLSLSSTGVPRKNLSLSTAGAAAAPAK